MEHKRTGAILIILLLVFAAIFFIAFAGLQSKQAIFELQGFSFELENWMIMFLCVGSIIKIVYELINLNKEKQLKLKTY